jgi:hypothetical protein
MKRNKPYERESESESEKLNKVTKKLKTENTLEAKHSLSPNSLNNITRHINIAVENGKIFPQTRIKHINKDLSPRTEKYLGELYAQKQKQREDQIKKENSIDSSIERDYNDKAKYLGRGLGSNDGRHFFTKNDLDLKEPFAKNDIYNKLQTQARKSMPSDRKKHTAFYVPIEAYKNIRTQVRKGIGKNDTFNFADPLIGYDYIKNGASKNIESNKITGGSDPKMLSATGKDLKRYAKLSHLDSYLTK